MPLLNFLRESTIDHRIISSRSALSRYKISQSLLGKKHSDLTKSLMSIQRSGIKSQWYGKPFPKVILDAAA